MIHKFIIELTDAVDGYENSVDYLERIYGAEEINDNEIYNQALEDLKNKIQSLYNSSQYRHLNDLEYGYNQGLEAVEDVLDELKK